MATLIDGYNLLHVTGMLGRRVGPRTLERARAGLLKFLATALTEAERAETTVVFDAQHGPPGLEGEQDHRGVRVVFAVGYADADDLLEELIRADSSPRRLVVVSSDHQIQRAAKRRRATAIDSDRWYDLCLQRRAVEPAETPVDDRPLPRDATAEAVHWVKTFSECAGADASSPEPPTAGDGLDAIDADLANPFPPGYAEDLLVDEAPDDERRRA